MKKSAVAKRYAKALLEIGRELEDISAVFSDNPELKRFVLNPMYKLEDRQGLVEKAANTLEFSPVVKKFLAVLVETRGIGIIEGISRAYSRICTAYSFNY